MASVPGQIAAAPALPFHRVAGIFDAELIGEPDRQEIGFDGKVEVQLSGPITAVPEGVLNDDPRVTVRAELESVDLQSLQYRAVSEPVAVGIVDKLGALGECGRLARYAVGDRRTKAIINLIG